MSNIYEYHEHRDWAFVFWTIIGFLVAIGIGIADTLTGYELTLSLFYLFPIALVTWLVGRRIGLIMTVVCTLIWYKADMLAGHTYSHPSYAYWNTTARFSFFLIVCLLLSALKKALEHEKELANVDHLTNTVNARFFQQLLKMEIDRSQRNNRPFTLVYMDLDNFKAINDTFGHTMGDKVLYAVVQYAKIHLRKTDFVARLGGDEFAFLLPETDQIAAQVIISKIQISLLEEMRKNTWSITFSIGVLTCSDDIPQTANELIKQADDLMYAVKNNGKNSINYSVYSS